MAKLSLLMGMDENGLKRFHGVMKQSMRMNYYPPCSGPELVLCVSPHSDGGSITILLQDDEITVLQIIYKEGWLPVKPLQMHWWSMLVMSLRFSDLATKHFHGFGHQKCKILQRPAGLEQWHVRSIEHRAITNANKARMSIAMFLLPDQGIERGPVESMMHDRPRLYKDIKYLTSSTLWGGKYMEKLTQGF